MFLVSSVISQEISEMTEV